jgi:hypothetical protein
MLTWVKSEQNAASSSKGSASSSHASRAEDPAPARSRAGRAWDIATVVAPIGISVIALVVAVLAYQDQHSANSSAAAANEKAYANLVSFWYAYSNSYGYPDSNYLIIQNLGQAPLYQVYLVFTVPAGATAPDSLKASIDSLGVLPPCSVSRLDIRVASLNGKQALLPASKAFSSTALVFTDTNGVTWERAFSGVLRRGRAPTNFRAPPSQALIGTKHATGCA